MSSRMPDAIRRRSGGAPGSHEDRLPDLLRTDFSHLADAMDLDAGNQFGIHSSGGVVLPGMIVLFLWQSIPVWRLTTEAIYANAAGEGE